MMIEWRYWRPGMMAFSARAAMTVRSIYRDQDFPRGEMIRSTAWRPRVLLWWREADSPPPLVREAIEAACAGDHAFPQCTASMSWRGKNCAERLRVTREHRLVAGRARAIRSNTWPGAVIRPCRAAQFTNCGENRTKIEAAIARTAGEVKILVIEAEASST